MVTILRPIVEKQKYPFEVQPPRTSEKVYRPTLSPQPPITPPIIGPGVVPSHAGSAGFSP